MVWCGMVWCGPVRYSTAHGAWYGTGYGMRYGMVCGMVSRYGTWYGTGYSTVWYGAVRYIMIWHRMARFGSSWRNSRQFSLVYRGMVCSGMVRHSSGMPGRCSPWVWIRKYHQQRRGAWHRGRSGRAHLRSIIPWGKCRVECHSQPAGAIAIVEQNAIASLLVLICATSPWATLLLARLDVACSSLGWMLHAGCRTGATGARSIVLGKKKSKLKRSDALFGVLSECR